MNDTYLPIACNMWCSIRNEYNKFPVDEIPFIGPYLVTTYSHLHQSIKTSLRGVQVTGDLLKFYCSLEVRSVFVEVENVVVTERRLAT